MMIWMRACLWHKEKKTIEHFRIYFFMIESVNTTVSIPHNLKCEIII